MQTSKKNIILGIVIIGIIGAVWYLEAKKPPHISSSNAPDVVTTPITEAPTSNGTPTVVAGATTAPQSRTSLLVKKAAEFSKAKEFVDPTGFINSAPFKLSDIVGKKVVLIDFWTYSCINCQRTLPYLKAWYAKYKDQGLEIVGVHAPEFDFEKNYDNVAAAVKALGITYPVVLDSNMGTWGAYDNNYWPAEYLIDVDGYVVHQGIGEGNYTETEQAIQKALIERDQVLGLPNTVPTGLVNPSDVVSMDGNKVQSPETYFGSNRNQYLANGTQGRGGSQTLTAPSTLETNNLYLGGTWNFQEEYAESTSPTSEIDYKYNTKNVYFVASSANGVKIRILKDGKPLGAEAGTDVAADGTVTIKENRLYTLINGSDYGEHTIQIQVQGAGLDAYTFTFG